MLVLFVDGVSQEESILERKTIVVLVFRFTILSNLKRKSNPSPPIRTNKMITRDFMIRSAVMKSPEDRRRLRPKVFSKHFPENIHGHDGACFVPFEEYRDLEKRYLKLFKRYQKSKHPHRP